MKIAVGLLFICGFVASTFAAEIVETRLRDLRPTQSSVGFDEIYYKLARFSKDKKKLFDAFCEFNGQTGIKELTESSDLHDANSFVCEEPIGSHPADMGTVVIAPNGQLYLTDGHHKVQEFWHAAGGGPDLKPHVVVARNDRALPSMEAFWKQMQADKNVWLFNAADRPISIADLPSSMGLEHFGDDPYRSLMYFTDHIAWEKPEPRVAFVEYYWARDVRKTVDLSHCDLTTPDGYLDAMRAVSDAILNSRSQNVGGSGRTAEQMGQRRSIKTHKRDRAIHARKDDLTSMLKYKTTLH